METDDLRIAVRGLVQGVGFRPFVYRLAQACEVRGWVQNTGAGVVIEASARPENLQHFISGLRHLKPELARIDDLELQPGQRSQGKDFVIRESQDGAVTTDFPLDLAICEECQRELFATNNRRFQYPFTTCAHCGPRFSILRALPFDRHNTSMAKFSLCSECLKEYSDPENRRFHAQTLSCPQCGPQLRLVGSDGSVRSQQDVIAQAAALLREGGALALKGIGGYHIAVDATNETAVQRLRTRKRRPEKPFAVMFSDLKRLLEFAQPTVEECQTLRGPVAPIVLVQGYKDGRLAPAVVQGMPRLGAMLPHSALHLLLSAACDRPLVMTSGNLAGGPVIIRDELALLQLKTCVDAFLIHDRDILHHADDSVVSLDGQERTVLRLGRGLAPYVMSCAGPSGVLALGGHQKNSFAIVNQRRLFVSQDMGNLDDYQNVQRLEAEIRSWLDLMKIKPTVALHDQHPDYGSSRMAPRIHSRSIGVQHHEAHIMACVMEQKSMESGLALAWDGWGLGHDGELWGGEFYGVNRRDEELSLVRTGSLLPFLVVGGDRAAREPWRSALGVAHRLFAEKTQAALEHHRAAGCLKEADASGPLLSLLDRGLMSGHCRSVGRLFDAVAALLDIRQVSTFEGQAAMLLEGLVDEGLTFDPYPIDVQDREGFSIVDWRPGIRALLAEMRSGQALSVLATRFHQMWVQAVLTLLLKHPHEHVFLSGGVFQNIYLKRCLREQLGKRNISVHSPAGLPLHDGNLAAGQVHWALSQGVL